MKLRNTFVDIMCNVNPEYKKYVRFENGKKVLYVQVMQALYGCIQSALLWYDLFSSTLEKEGFKINPYDCCVANKDINGHQCTIAWYVDNNKLSHKDANVVSEVLKIIKAHFGDLTVSRGKKHTFLGMNITIRKDKKVQIEMKDQVKETILAFDEDVTTSATTTAALHLFDINNDCPKLDEARSDNFHHVVAKLLYLSKRARPDIETAVAFLCTRVTKVDEDDWKKLLRVLKYLRSTIDLVRVIGASSLTELFSFIDAAYAVHWDMRSHTGGIMSMGCGALHTKSSRQKLNTKSSTEAEIVGISDYLPYNIWMRNFMKEQGYDLDKNVIYQDNQSAIRMERNGRNSCTGNSRHVDIRYFFVKDRVDKKEVTIEYCPTYIMLADYFTKALQGKQFAQLRDVIMGKISIQQLFDMNTALKERVGKRLSKIVSTDSLKGLGRENDQVGSLKSSMATQRTYADVLVGRK